MKHSKNFSKVKLYYDSKRWTIEMVWNATKNPKSNPWITVEEFTEITGQEPLEE